MAEYYPLLAKAVASLPNSTPESRKVVYERARKALIGQLRTLHPPVADQDIERESLALDRAIERLEGELGAPSLPVPPSKPEGEPPQNAKAADRAAPRVTAPKTLGSPPRFPASGGALGPSPSKPAAPLRTKIPLSRPIVPKSVVSPDAATQPPSSEIETRTDPKVPLTTKILEEPKAPPEAKAPEEPGTPPLVAPEASVAFDQSVATAPPPMRSEPSRDSLAAETAKARSEPQRPFAPQPPVSTRPKRPYWIIPVGVGVVVLLVAFAAYKLRDRPETLVRAKPAEQTSDSNKIAARVGTPAAPPATSQTQIQTDTAPPVGDAAPAPAARQQAAQGAANPAAAIAGRAALLVEAPDEPNKVKTYLGTVVWRLDNVSDGQNQAIGLAVRADIELPDDKLKASVVFQKNLDASLPASHTMKVRFMVEPGGATGSVKQINVPQMRSEDNATGEPLDGVTVPIVENSFLVGLSPGNSETANLALLTGKEWIDVPMFLTSGKIAKLTFEKTEAGQRDLQEAIASWSK